MRSIRRIVCFTDPEPKERRLLVLPGSRRMVRRGARFHNGFQRRFKPPRKESVAAPHPWQAPSNRFVLPIASELETLR